MRRHPLDCTTSCSQVPNFRGVWGCCLRPTPLALLSPLSISTSISIMESTRA